MRAARNGANKGSPEQESALALWYRVRTADRRMGTRKTMIVALARKLIIALWRTPLNQRVRPAIFAPESS